MSSEREDCNNDLTTDAFPSPPRGNNQNSRKISSDESDNNKETAFDDEINTNNSRAYYKKTKPRGFTKVKRTNPATAYASIININNSTDVHVGATISYNLNRSEKPTEKPEVIETNAIKSLRSNTHALTRNDLLFVSTHMNETWQDVARALKFSDGQIQQFLFNHKHSGIKEVIYQTLLDWSQNEPTDATVGNLSNILWENNQRDVVRRWSEKHTSRV